MQNKTIFGRLDGLIRLLDIRLYKNSVSLYTIAKRIVTKYNKKQMVTRSLKNGWLLWKIHTDRKSQ